MSNGNVKEERESDQDLPPTLDYDGNAPETTTVTPLTTVDEDGTQQDDGHIGGQRGWRSKLRDQNFRRKLRKTLWLCISYVAIGVIAAQRGPAFLDLQLITNTNVQQASAFFTAGSVGWVVGSLSGGLVYDLLSKSLLLILGVAGMAVTTVATPFCTMYALMVAVSFLGAITGGMVDTAGNAEIIRIWGSGGGSAMQAIHFSFAFGGVIAPLFTEPFLAPRAGAGHSNVTTFPATERVHFDGSYAESGHLNATTTPMEHLHFLSPSATGGPANTTRLPGLFPYVTDKPEWTLEETHLQAEMSGPSTAKVPDAGRRTAWTSLPDWIAAVNTSGPQVILVEDRTQEHVHQLNDRGFNQSEHNASAVTTGLWGGFQNATGDVTDASQHTRVHYAFLIAGLVAFVSAVLLLVEYLSNNKDCKKKWRRRRKQRSRRRSGDTEDKKKDGEKNGPGGSRLVMPRVVYVLVLVWVCTFYMLYVATEDTFVLYLSTFAVMELDWSKSDGAMLTSVFWGCFAASRFTCIWLSRVMTSVQLLTICCILLVVSFVGFLVAALLALPWAVWTFTGFIGASMSAIFPTGLSWMEEELVAVTGRTSSAIALASMFILTVNQQVLGYLMETRSAIWLAYLLLAEALACLLTFLLLLLFSRSHLRPRYGTRRQQRQEINDDVTEGQQAETFLRPDV
nr:hypothetical protein BaRGS_025777 [Batillaria attramentaria]